MSAKYSQKRDMLNNLPQMRLKLLEKEQFVKKLKQLAIRLLIKLLKLMHVERITLIVKLNLKIQC